MFRTRTTTVVAVVFCLLLAGCGGLVGSSDLFESETPSTPHSPTPAPSTTQSTQSTTSQPTTTQPTPSPTPSERIDPQDPSTDVLGWENGYWYNESISVDASDGLGYEEIEPLLNRSMARVEYLRRHEFTRNISVRVPTRNELRRLLENQESGISQNRVLNQYYETLFFIDENTDAATIASRNNANAILGFYIPDSDTINLIANESGVLRADESLFIHELTHALQDEYKGTVTRSGGPDRSRAYSGLVEGEANYIEARFEEQCATGKWDCVQQPSNTQQQSSNTQRSLANLSHPGIALLGYFPYSDGPAFIHDVYANGRNGRTGWDAVDSLFVNQPKSSSQIIHPQQYPAENPYQSSISTDIDPRNGWRSTVIGSYGEAAIFTMFWQQSYERGVNIINPRSAFKPDNGQYDRFNYTSTPSEGLQDDHVISVTNGTENGYVWMTKWDSKRDAREFYNAYRKLLAGYNAERASNNVWMIPNGGFEDAFYVRLEGTTVTIVNGPSVDDLNDIYPKEVTSTTPSKTSPNRS